MKKLILLVVLILALFAVSKLQKHSPGTTSTELEKFSVALDWTPNTNHTGIYVALQKGWYKDAGLDVRILPYSQNSTADLLVSTGKADAGISSTENIVSDAATGNPVISVAAIVAHNTSGLLALSDRASSPKDLNRKIYGGFGAPYEQSVINAIIKKDGGIGEFQNIALDTSAMQALETKKIDFVWIFEGWEGIIAKQSNLKTNFFPITKYGVPDYYTPTIIASPREIRTKHELLKIFMKATARGYEFARKYPKEAAKILIEQNPKGTFPDPKIVYASQEFLSKVYAEDGKKWGVQEKKMWHEYPQFMLDAGAVTDAEGKKVNKIDFDSLYTNEFLK